MRYEREAEFEFSESEGVIWHNVLPLGTFYDPRYGKVEITREMIEKMAANFKAGIPHYQVPVNIGHKDEMGAVGYVEDLEAREDGLWAKMVLTDEGRKLVQEKRFRYFSAEFADKYMNKQTGQEVEYVFLGVALTMRPAHPGMKPLSEGGEEVIELADVPRWPIDEDSPWSWDWAKDANAIIEKGGWSLLAQACAYVDTRNYEKGESGLPENKAAYKLPFAKLKDGRMTIYRRGVIAAMQALLGARGGVDIPRDDRKKVYNKLAALYKRMDMEPPEFHFEEVKNVAKTEEAKGEVKELEEKLKTLAEQVEALRTEREELVKKLEEVTRERDEIAAKLRESEVRKWADEWKRRGVVPKLVDKAVAYILEENADQKMFDELFEEFARPELLKQLGEAKSEDVVERAERVAKIVYGGDK